MELRRDRMESLLIICFLGYSINKIVLFDKMLISEKVKDKINEKKLKKLNTSLQM